MKYFSTLYKYIEAGESLKDKFIRGGAILGGHVVGAYVLVIAAKGLLKVLAG